MAEQVTVPASHTTGSPAKARSLNVRVWRGGEAGGFHVFEVPRLESQTVLDVVTYIQRNLDPTLAYRYACRVGMCGSCAMNVNGKARWTCRTHVAEVERGDAVEIAPALQLAGDQRPGD
jgi:fumarate reductase iron-sulfur subunit